MRSILPLLLAACPAMAQDLTYPLSCTGVDPDWSLEVTEDGATFDFLRASALDIALITPAQGADWPQALTLVGRGDSAIVMIEPATCDVSGGVAGTLSARVLTQRGETPLLLVGCCAMPIN